MTHAPTRFRDAVLREDFRAFIAKTFRTVNPATPYGSNWHIDAMAEALGACERGEITRLIINLPPRSLKSICVSVAWPAWLLGQNPAERILAASYAKPLAQKLSLDCRLVMNSGWYRRAFPATRVLNGRNTQDKFVTSQQGFRLATSVGSSVIGEGGNVLIVDDPHNPRQANSKPARVKAVDWFSQAFLTRLDRMAEGCVVVVMQRLHAEDLCGHLLNGAGWEQLCLPAVEESTRFLRIGSWSRERAAGELLHPERDSMEQLERRRTELGSRVFDAQYLQRPAPPEGELILRKWFKRYPHVRGEYQRVVQSWDTAVKAGEGRDASVCVTLGVLNNAYHVLDVVCLRVDYPELKRAAIALAEAFSPQAVLIEDAGSGQALVQELQAGTLLPVVRVLPRKDKIARVTDVLPLLESGRVWLPQRAPWLDAFEAELLAFPGGRHDDQVDALTQALSWVNAKDAAMARIRGL